MGLKTGIFGGGGKLTWNRFTGPGRLAIQTLFIAPLEGIGSAAEAAGAGGIAGALIGGLARRLSCQSGPSRGPGAVFARGRDPARARPAVLLVERERAEDHVERRRAPSPRTRRPRRRR